MRSMDDPRWLRIITIGLVLAAMAVGYFLIAGRFSGNKSTQTQALKQAQPVYATPSPTYSPTPLPSPSPQALGSATESDSQTKGGIQTLPKTGFPIVLIGVFSAAAIVSGWSLRKFPN